MRYGPKSGYDLKQIIKRDIEDFAKIKLPTIYYHLEKLNEKGYVTYIIEKDGNRPEKQIYSLTTKGEDYFQKLFKKQLMDETEFEFLFDGILYFKDNIDNEQLKTIMISKKQKLINTIEALKVHQEHTLSSMKNKDIRFCADAIFQHHTMHYETELQWIEYVLKGLS